MALQPLSVHNSFAKRGPVDVGIDSFCGGRDCLPSEFVTAPRNPRAQTCISKWCTSSHLDDWTVNTGEDIT